MCSAKTKCTLVRIKLAIAFCYAMNFEMFKLDLEKAEKPEMETHSSVLAWRIPGMGEPDGLPSMGSQSRTRLKRLSSSSSSRGTRDQIASICWIFKKSRVPEKTSTSALLIVPKPLTVWITTNWKILHKMGIPDDLTCLLRNLYAGQEETIRTGHGTTDWFQIGKGVRQGCILSPCLFNLCAEYIMSSAGLEETQAGVKIAGRNINNLRYADDTTLMAESEELKSLVMKVKERLKKLD